MNRHIAQASPVPSRQKGVALLVVLMLSMVAMTAGLITAKGAETELQIAHNNVQGQRALAIAEAGLNHAIALIRANGLPFTDELDGLGGGGFIALSDVTRDFRENNVSNFYRFRAFGSDNVNDGYFVRVSDNFDETAGADNPQADIDNRIKVISRGRFGNAERTVTVQIGPGPPAPRCAIVTRGDLQITAGLKVTGSQGCVHTNANLIISNGSLSQGARSSGTMTITGDFTSSGQQINAANRTTYIQNHSGRAKLPIPAVRPFKFGFNQLVMWELVMNHPRGYRLDADGKVYAGPGYVVNPEASASTRGRAGIAGPARDGGDDWNCSEGSGIAGTAGYVAPNCTGGQLLGDASGGWNGYKFASDSATEPKGKWDVASEAIDGVFFVEGHMVISGNPGNTGLPGNKKWRATVIALNSIGMSGNPTMAPYNQSKDPLGPGFVAGPSDPGWKVRNILFISGNDVELNGNGTNKFEAGIFAHQQIKLNGDPFLEGFIVAEDADPHHEEALGPDADRTWPGDPGPHCHSKQFYICDPKGNAVTGNARINFDSLECEGCDLPRDIVRIGASFADVR